MWGCIKTYLAAHLGMNIQLHQLPPGAALRRSNQACRISASVAEHTSQNRSLSLVLLLIINFWVHFLLIVNFDYHFHLHHV
jgi:hypothetical protein